MGSFHLYPAYDYAAGSLGALPDDQNDDMAACTAVLNGTTPDTTVECAGQNVVMDVQDRIGDFATYGAGNVASVFMTEGSWGPNADISADAGPMAGSPQYFTDMRSFNARYSLLIAATQGTNTSVTPTVISREHWLGWAGAINDISDAVNPGGPWGVACDTHPSGSPIHAAAPPCYTMNMLVPNDGYAGLAYGQVIDWLGTNNYITLCTAGITAPLACTDNAGSIWALPIGPSSTSSPDLIVWTWDNPSGGVTCPTTPTSNPGCPSLTGYSHYQTLDGNSYSLGSPKSITLDEEPKLLY